MNKEKKSLLEKILHINLFGRVQVEKIEFNSAGTQDSFVNPYAHPFNIGFVKLMNRKNWFKFTRKLPFIWVYLFSKFCRFISGLDKKFKTQTMDNVEFVLKDRLQRYDHQTREKIKEYIALKHFEFMGRLWFEDLLVFCSFRRYPSDVPKYVKGFGLEKIDEAKRKGKGVILLAAHHGHHMVCTSFLGYSGYKVTQLIDVKTVPAIINDMKAAIDVIDAVEQDPSVGKSINKVLENNGILIWLADSGYKIFPYVKFFSEYCRTVPAVAAKALKFGSPILPIWVKVNKKKSRWTVHVGDEIELVRDSSLPKRQLILHNTRLVNKALEKIILKNLPSWSFLSVVDKTKRISKEFKIKGLHVKPNLLEELDFFEKFIKNSYEENRPDEKILGVIEELKNKLDDL
ncbi:MAG: lysophospholipid acyltransferase family protein [Candidatus Helarchaeota archaeon]